MNNSLFIFALVGAVCMIVVTGGALSMMNGEQPSNSAIGIGASVGGLLGALLSQGVSGGNSLGSQAEESIKGLTSMFGGGDGDGTLGMRVGLAPQGL